jgi:hypothetical protein
MLLKKMNVGDVALPGLASCDCDNLTQPWVCLNQIIMAKPPSTVPYQRQNRYISTPEFKPDTATLFYMSYHPNGWSD